MIVLGSNLYVVSGYVIAKVDSSGASTTIGSLAGTGPVSITHNEKASSQQIVIVADGQRFVMIRDRENAGGRGVVYVENWFNELLAKIRN